MIRKRRERTSHSAEEGSVEQEIAQRAGSGTFGATLVAMVVFGLRRERKLSREDLARAAGVSRQTIISIEKGRCAPSFALAFTLASIFDTSTESMFIPGD